MANTISIVISKNAWTNISNGKTEGRITNATEQSVRYVESLAQPDDNSQSGHTLSGWGFVDFNFLQATNIWIIGVSHSGLIELTAGQSFSGKQSANDNLISKIERPIYQFLTIDGSQDSSHLITGDYSGAVEEFFIKPKPTGSPGGSEIFLIKHFTVHIHDNNKLVAGGYVGSNPLINGIRIVLSKGADLSSNIINDFTSSAPIFVLANWSKYGGLTDFIEFGPGDEFLSINFELRTPIPVDGANDELFGVIVNDDFTGLIDHTIFITASVFDRG